jgi:hypothetical protein
VGEDHEKKGVEMIATIREKIYPRKAKITCPDCLNKRGKTQGVNVILLMITAAGCGLPGIITIPLMIFFAIKGAIPCQQCRQAKTA